MTSCATGEWAQKKWSVPIFLGLSDRPKKKFALMRPPPPPQCFREISLPVLGQDPTNHVHFSRWRRKSLTKPPTWVFQHRKQKKIWKLHLNDLNNERLHWGLRYSAKRNETLFRTRKQNKDKILLPLAIFKDHIKRYLTTSPTTSKRSFPPPRRTVIHRI